MNLKLSKKTSISKIPFKPLTKKINIINTLFEQKTTEPQTTGEKSEKPMIKIENKNGKLPMEQITLEINDKYKKFFEEPLNKTLQKN